jgi:uncharacterized protein (TIGR02145 family)
MKIKILNGISELRLIAIIFFTFHSLNAQIFTPGSGVVDIDGNYYQTIIINGQEWMAENLRTSRYSNGDNIPNVTDINLWSTLSSGAWANMQNDSQFDLPYGKLYNWYAASDTRNVCPTDWRVPSDSDWNVLIQFLDASQNPFQNDGVQSSFAGGKMKSTENQYWTNGNVGATNESGFTGRPGGRLEPMFPESVWEPPGSRASFWSSTLNELNPSGAWHRRLTNYDASVYRSSLYIELGISIRCLKDATSGVNELKPSLKSLLKVTDMLGREIDIRNNEVLFYQYSDGSVEKKVIVE